MTVAQVWISVEFLNCKKEFSRSLLRGPEPHDGKPLRTGRKSAGGRRRGEPRPKPERLASAVVPVTFQLGPEHKRYRQRASATPASEHKQRRGVGHETWWPRNWSNWRG